jgi:hypothetical protein
MAERALSASVITAIEAGTICPVIFCELEYDSGGSPAFLRLFTGVGQITWDSKVWTGGRDLLSISPIRETKNPEAIGFEVVLSGLPSANLALVLSALRKNKPGRLWLGFLDAAGAVIADPYALRRGRFDIAPISRDGDSMTVRARYEDRLIDLERPRERRYTREDQQLRLAGDKGFDQVPELQDMQDVWG